jgi:outer membrane cobalamin receptor
MQKLVPGVLVVPNDTLHAEKGWSSEIGLNQGFKIGATFVGFVDVAFYYNQYSDFTQYDFGLWQNRFAGSGKAITVDTSFLNTPINHLLLFGVQAHNIENARIFGYELTAGGRGKIGKVGITFSIGYNYNYGSSLDSYNGDHYSAGKFFADAFKYNGQRITDTTSIEYHHLLQGSVRHVFKTDLELKYWRIYVGTTVVYASYPEELSNALVFAVDYLAGPNAIQNYENQHKHGDVVGDVRMGYAVNAHMDLGFIIKNIGNRFYELRPGRPEAIRSYTVQLRYKF